MNGTTDPHICFICPYIDAYLKPGSGTHVGGAQRQQYLLANRLRDEGYTVSFIAFESDGREFKRVKEFNVWRTLPTTNAVLRTPEVLTKLLRTLKKINADVYYTRGNPPLGILSSYCCTLVGEPLVYVIANDSNVELARLPSHHGVFRYTIPKLAYLDAIRRAKCVISQTQYQHNILANVFGIESSVVPNGYTLPSENEIVPPTERTDVLWVGSLDPDQKRPDRFLRVAEHLPAIKFRMIGWTNDETYRENIQNQANQLENLTFEGFVPPDQIHRYYQHAVMLVNTSEYEGFPNTFLEAWRFGVPVVSLYYTLDDVLTEHNLGYHAGSMDELVRIITWLWHEREASATVGENGRLYLKENYSMDVVFEKYNRLFNNAME